MFFHRDKKKIIGIEGMHCDNCAKKIEVALENLVDISKATVDLKKKQVIIRYTNTIDDFLIRDTIEKLGYTITGIRENS